MYLCVRWLCRGLLRCLQEKELRDINAHKNLIFVYFFTIYEQLVYTFPSCEPDHRYYYYKICFGEDNIINNKTVVSD